MAEMEEPPVLHVESPTSEGADPPPGMMSDAE